MYKKYLNCYNVLITGLLTLTLGILVLTLNQKFIVLIIYLVAALLMIYAISNIIKLITKKEVMAKLSFQLIYKDAKRYVDNILGGFKNGNYSK